jgi:phosphoribosylanthranilate isomerase
VPSGSPLFHVKICGVTTPADARDVAAAGADAVGLNFVPGSPRCLAPGAALEIVRALPGGVIKVGVFAGMPAVDIRRVAAEVGLDAIQLHGHLAGEIGPIDRPETGVDLGGLPVIRAVRLEVDRLGDGGGDVLEATRDWLAAARRLGAPVAMALVDAGVPAGGGADRLGGTGVRVDWRALAGADPLDVPMALAGGLGPENVAEAIRVTGVVAVDAASGVEAAPGRKDAVRMRAFVAAARKALGLPPAGSAD